MFGKYNGNEKFRILRDKITCNLTSNEYTPLNYSTSRLDGRLPSVFLVDETGALPNSYALEAMRSGQLTILNKLGCVISTKYPTTQNPFEDEVAYCKKILDGVVEDDTVFALLYEPDSGDILFWHIRAMYKLGSLDLTQKYLAQHAEKLSEEQKTVLESILSGSH